MINHSIPRLPTLADLDQLEAKVLEPYGKSADEEDRETVRGFIQQAAIAVFNHYTTDGPGYTGKLMCVVWSGAETFYEVYCWNEKQEIMHVNQDTGFFHEKEESKG